jgi:ribonuclease P protein component
VERNRAKRLAREVFRRHRVATGLDIIIVPRREMLDASFANLEADYVGALERRDRERPRSAPGHSRGGPRRRPAPRV